MGENKALDEKLKALEDRLNKRVDNKSALYSGYWSLFFGSVLFIVLSLKFGQEAFDASAEVIEATLASLEFIIRFLT